MSYTSYDRDKLEAADNMRIERTVYFESDKSDISALTALPLEQLQTMREESAAAEQAIFESLQQQAAAWEQQAGKTLDLNKAIEYARTPAAEHTQNQWEQPDEYRHVRSNRVYQMDYRISENTRYDKEAQKSVPYSWSLTWNVRTNAPGGYRQGYIAGQDRKVFADKTAMEKYLNGRIKAYDRLFTEIAPPVPKEYADFFKVNGQLLPGYIVEGEQPQQTAPQQEAAPAEPQKATPEAAQSMEADAQPKPVIPINLTAEKPTEKLKEITDRLEQGITELFDSERYKEYLRVMSKFHNYSFNNTLLIAMQKPDASLIAGFNSWKNQFQRNVKKGEKGIKIIAPSPFKIKQETEKIDPHTQTPVIGKDGKPVTEEKEITIPAYKVVSVFDVSQTEGRELPDIAVDALTGDVEQYKDFFAALEKTAPVPIGFEKIESGAHGYYHLEEKRIALDEGMSELQTLKTAIHEIAHAKLHDIDLNAPKDEQQPRVDRRTREVEAESVAYTFCQHYGLDTSDYSFGYVAGWSTGRELAELKSSLETIRSTAAEIINSIDGHIAEIQKEQTAAQEQPGIEEWSEPATAENAPENPGVPSDDISAYLPDHDTFTIYQLKRGDETRDLRFEPYDRLQATGHVVDPANYDLIYSAPLTPDMTLERIYERFNIDHPADFKGHSLSVSDVVVLHQNGQDAAHYVDSIGYQQVPEFLQPVPQPALVPEDYKTGEKITTPRGTFSLTDMTHEQMKEAGYGFHHQSDDGKYHIMANGTQAFAIAAEQPEKANPLKHVEDTIEQNDNNFDGLINNTPQTPTVGELEQKVKAGEPISLTALAEAIKADKERSKEEKPSIRAQLKAAKEQTAPKKVARSKSQDLERS